MTEQNSLEYQALLERQAILEEKIKRQEGLPHLHGWKFYKWAREFFESRNHMSFLCAANQISKSSTQIRKHIDWATDVEKWPTLWRTKPQQFWYLYPSRDVAHIEFKKKWEPEFMPRGEYKEHPQYGWKPEFYHNRIFAIHWFSGVSTYFKTYAQDVQDLQTGSVHKLDLDEETPEEIMGELFMRLQATDGYLSAAFTATIGQDYWREIIEERGPRERFPEAFKRQVSMYDCLFYEDGSPSHWTEAKIQRAKNACKSQAEIDRRIYGKFVAAENLKYPSFSKGANRKKGHPLPKDWSIWVGVDVGSGGADNHPSAIAMTAVSPDFRQGRVFRGWRGDGIITDAGYVVNKVIEMTEGLEGVRIFYDWSCRDFLTIAQRMGLHVEPAEKSHEIGTQVLNVLFKNQMLMIYDYPELDGLVSEFGSLKTTTAKNKAKDDFIDACRYSVTKVPWDWSAVRSEIIVVPEMPKRSALEIARQNELEARRGQVSNRESGLITIEEELAAWDDLLLAND